MTDQFVSIPTDSLTGVKQRMKDMNDGTHALVISATLGGGSGGNVDREIAITQFRVKTAFTGASVGDIITAGRVLDVTSTPTQVGQTLWWNENTGQALSAPSSANIEPIGASGITNAQMTALVTMMLGDGANLTIGGKNDATATDDTGGWTLMARIKRVSATLVASYQEIINTRDAALSTAANIGDGASTPATDDTSIWSLNSLLRRISVKLSGSLNVTGQAAVARQLPAAVGASTNTPLTTTARRVSLYGRLADMRYAIGAAPQTASATTSHFIGLGDRVDLTVPANAQIAVIAAGNTAGVLEVTEIA